MTLTKPQERNLALLHKHGQVIYNTIDVYNRWGKYKPGPDGTRSRTRGANITALQSLVRMGLAEMRADKGESPGFAEGKPGSRRWLAFIFSPA